ncbi:unnamed protein product [Scytosiphon promiscuus]
MVPGRFVGAPLAAAVGYLWGRSTPELKGPEDLIVAVGMGASFLDVSRCLTSQSSSLAPMNHLAIHARLSERECTGSRRGRRRRDRLPREGLRGELRMRRDRHGLPGSPCTAGGRGRLERVRGGLGSRPLAQLAGIGQAVERAAVGGPQVVLPAQGRVLRRRPSLQALPRG